MHTIFVSCNYYKIFELSHISEGSTTLSYIYIVTQYFHLVVRYKCKLKYSHTFSENLTTLTLRRLMSYIYGAPILDVSRSHTTTQHSR